MSYIVNLGVSNCCRPEEAFFTRRKAMDLKFYYAVKSIRYLSDMLLLIALAVALYARWVATDDVSIAWLAMLSCFVFPIALAFSYYFQMQHISQVIYSLWVGALIGVNALLSKVPVIPGMAVDESFDFATSEQIVDGVLLLHVVTLLVWLLTERVSGMTLYDKKLLHESDLFIMLGFGVAGTVSDHFVGITMFLIALAVTIGAIRLKSYWSLINLALLLGLSACCFFPALNITPDNSLIIVFITDLVSAPILDLYFNPSSVFDRWLAFFRLRHILRLLLVAFLMVIEMIFLASCGGAIVGGHDMYFTIPAFMFCSILWVCFHVIFLLTLWKFMSRITDCMPHVSKTDENVSARLSTVMASKGMRYFCIVSQRLIIVTVFSTACLASVAWQPSTPFMALFLTILPVELLSLSMLNELSASVGGTCLGYALIAPNSLYRLDGNVTPLPQSHVQDLNIRSTELLVSIQNFFREHLIDMFGCDYSINGLEPMMLENKIKALFGSNTSDGLKYDSYILYYSGHTYQNGDWAMSDGTAISLGKILQWWSEKIEENTSRLIIMVDSLHGHQWEKAVKQSNNVCIGLQTIHIPDRKKRDVDLVLKTGEFTRDWIQFNSSSNEKDISGLRIPEFSVYFVSRYWADYEFKMPSDSDIMNHSHLHFPRFTWPFIKIVSCPYWSVHWILCDPVIKCARRLKMKWLPPKILDTGHGFYFISS